MKWEMKTFDKLCDEITVGFVGTMAAHYADEGITFLRSQNIEPFKLNLELSQLKFITPDFHSKIQKSALRAGDIAIVRTGYPGTACVIPDTLGDANCADLVIARPSQGVDSRFICYVINSPYTKAMIGGSLVGSAQKHFNVGVAKRLEIPCPPLPIQQKITSILSAYDDLIENNQKRIRLLEEAAQRLYQEWFVKFRFPGWKEVEMVNGLPEGWERKQIGEVCDTIGGGTPSTKEPRFWEGGEIIWFSPTDLSKKNSLVLLDSATKITQEGLKNSSAKILPPRTILMSSRATIGLFGIINKPCSTNQGFISIIPKNADFRYYFLFNLISRKLEIINNANGSIFKEITKKKFREMEVLMPPAELAKRFNSLTEIFLGQVENLEMQNQKLKEARDLLLPRLMNQTIEV